LLSGVPMCGNAARISVCIPEPRSGLGIVRANIIEYAFEIS
jgi:hypothetical protein